jgi:hypothetical protein
MGSIGLPELLIVLIFCTGFAILPFWMIFAKAGFPAWLSLFMLFPLVNIVILYYVAFAQWNNPPAERQAA